MASPIVDRFNERPVGVFHTRTPKKGNELQIKSCYLRIIFSLYIINENETLESISYFAVFQRGMDTFRTKTQFVMVCMLPARSFVLT